jgi:5-(carboxyamino)imidazole ribonucleotide synthase
MFDTTTKIGILGGGQLGKMLCLAAANWDFKTYVLDADPAYPAGAVCTGFTTGNFNDYDDVLAFGQDKDVITIEIEHVNTDALRALERMGKQVHPAPDVLDMIKDKGLQKEFYQKNGIPTARFALYDDEKGLRQAIENGHLALPFVQKTRTGGYDGRGVAIIRTSDDLAHKLLPGPCLVEELVDIHTELAVVAARNAQGETTTFPPVEMAFHPEANLVEFLFCPSQQPPDVLAQAEALARMVIEATGICGLLAVELLLAADGRLLVNEVAPRPHNSGHHTIDSATTSQFQQHLRAICNLPLGDTRQLRPAVMVNLLGEAGHRGPARYEGAAACLALEGVHLHLYGKTQTTPFRKMGHATTTGATLEEAMAKAKFVQETLRVIAEGGA